ncbi:hypothetical protein PCANC_06484 [Puccinia coronata f. sp. avenae]|uniref:Uncharacterized protein n=1 Tax=Puccinia coronata f. sp. avenae TaxID=200324 RepID=A0A2N5VVZ6_9BASI|nr:hypothetical protein PCANC_06484 [Puccinia coronata f. sp. avenae]
MPNPQQPQFFHFVGAMYPPPGLPFPTPPYPQQQNVTPPYQHPSYGPDPHFQQLPYAPPPSHQTQQTLRPAENWHPPPFSNQKTSHWLAQSSNRSTMSGGALARMANIDVENVSELLSGMDFHSMSAGIDDQLRDLEPQYQAQGNYASTQTEGTQ